jgi:hypothetical protein
MKRVEKCADKKSSKYFLQKEIPLFCWAPNNWQKFNLLSVQLIDWSQHYWYRSYDRGFCKDQMKPNHYTYDPNTQSCEKYLSCGNGKSRNQFQDLDSCQDKCGDKNDPGMNIWITI